MEERRCDRGEMEGVVEGYMQKFSQIDVIAVSDVRGLDQGLYDYLEGRCRKLVKVKGDMELPIKNRYGTPGTLGADRICAAVGAHTLFPEKNCVIVDFGTAITFDFLTGEGEFLGGAEHQIQGP